MKRKKKIIPLTAKGKLALVSLPLILIGFVFRSHAAATFNFHLTDMEGKEIILPVDENLHFHISGSSLVVSSASDEITMSVADLKGISYNPVSSVAELPVSSLPAVSFTESAITISFKDDSEGAKGFRVYDDKGDSVMQGECRGETMIPLSFFDKGMYMLCIENSPALKFMVK